MHGAPVTGTLSEYFERIYILNLPDRKDRLREMSAHLSKFGTPVDGKSVRVFPGIKPEDRKGFRNRGIRGCFLSHLAILQESAADKLYNVLVMEDDLAVSPGFPHAAPYLITQLKAIDWQFAYLGHFLELDCSEGPKFVQYNERIRGAHFLGLKGRVLGSLIPFLEELLSRPPGDPEGGPMAYDGALSFYRKRDPALITLAACPSMGSQRPSRSDLSPRWFDDIPLMRQAANSMRRLLR